ncbi:MAG: hypothetical protein R3A80_10285 [Bdellovibrionota bacterium]
MFPPKSRISLFFMVFIGLIFIPAHAEQAQELFKKTVATNLTSLAALGLKKMGSKEISKLLRESQKTKWVPLDVFGKRQADYDQQG